MQSLWLKVSKKGATISLVALNKAFPCLSLMCKSLENLSRARHGVMRRGGKLQWVVTCPS